MTPELRKKLRGGPGAGDRKKLPETAIVSGVSVKRVEVPYPTSNSGVSLTAQVSLPCAPWEKEGGE